MKRPEALFWQAIKRGMSSLWVASRHEDAAGIGVPDVSFAINGVDGWIELKTLPAWPIRPTTRVRLPHFTKVQRAWLMRRGRAGAGRVFMFLKVGREKPDFLLLHWKAITLDDKRTRAELERDALLVFSDRVDWVKFAIAISPPII